MLAHKKSRLVDRVCSVRVFIVGDENIRRYGSAEGCCGWIAKGHRENLCAFGIGVVNPANVYLFGGFARARI